MHDNSKLGGPVGTARIEFEATVDSNFTVIVIIRWISFYEILFVVVIILQKREVEYDKFQRDKLLTAKSDFRVLLHETKILTYKSRDLVRESDRHYKDIIDILRVSGMKYQFAWLKFSKFHFSLSHRK